MRHWPVKISFSVFQSNKQQTTNNNLTNLPTSQLTKRLTSQPINERTNQSTTQHPNTDPTQPTTRPNHPTTHTNPRPPITQPNTPPDTKQPDTTQPDPDNDNDNDDNDHNDDNWRFDRKLSPFLFVETRVWSDFIQQETIMMAAGESSVSAGTVKTLAVVVATRGAERQSIPGSSNAPPSSTCR